MKLIIIKEDIFKSKDSYCIVHCVGSDFVMGAGIAAKIKKRYPNLKKYLLKYSTKEMPEVIRYKDESNRVIYNLVTKKSSYGKPLRESMTTCLHELKKQVGLNNDKFLIMPLIGAGLDKLSWSETEKMIKKIFIDNEITIVICYQENNKHLLSM